MQYARIVALVGVVVGVVGLAMESLTTEGSAFLAALNQANPEVPDGIPTIWGGLDTWAQVVLVVLIIVVVVLSLRPPIREAVDRISALSLSVIGFALLAYAIVKWLDAADKADALTAVFGQAAQAGALPSAFSVDTGVGFFVLFLGTAMVLLAGILSLMANTKKEAAAG